MCIGEGVLFFIINIIIIYWTMATVCGINTNIQQ